MKSKTIAAILLVMALTFTLRIPAFYEYLAWDEGNYAYVANEMLDGLSPYKDLPIDKEPGIFFLYAGVFKFFGNDSFSIRLFGALWVCMTAFLVFLLGRRLGGDTAGLLGAFFYGLSMAGINNCGIRTNTEVFMTLLSVVGYMCAFISIEDRKPAYLFAAGLAVGLNISMKLSAVMDLAGIMVFVSSAYLAQRHGGGRTGLLRSGVPLLFAGSVLALAPFGVYLAHEGAVKEAWEQVIIWRFANLGRAAADTVPVLDKLKESLKPIVVDQAGMVAASLVTLLWATAFRRDRRWVLLSCWVVFSAIAVSMTGRFAPYYFPLLVPPMSLFAGYGLSRLLTGDRPFLKAAHVLVALFVFGCTVWFVEINSGYFKGFVGAISAQSRGEISKHEFQRLLQPDVIDFYDAADYVRQHTEADDFTFFWVNSGEYYWHVKRRASSGYLSPIPPGRNAELEAKHKEIVLNDVLRNVPKYFIVRDAVIMYTIPPFRSTDELASFRDLDSFLKQRYRLEKIFGRVLVYRLVDDADGWSQARTQVFFPEFMNPTAGYLERQDWLMYSDGSFSKDFVLDDGDTHRKFVINAKGLESGGVYPHISVSIDGKAIYDAYIDSGEFRPYAFSAELPAGKHNMVISYDNDRVNIEAGKDRNLYFRSLIITNLSSEMRGV